MSKITLRRFTSRAMGIVKNKRNAFLIIEASSRWAKMAPRARKVMRDRKPLQGLSTSKLPEGMVIWTPSIKIGIPIILTSTTDVKATKFFNGKEMVVMMFSGKGNMKSRNKMGKSKALVIGLPTRKRLNPRIKKKIENPEIENT